MELDNNEISADSRLGSPTSTPPEGTTPPLDNNSDNGNITNPNLTEPLLDQEKTPPKGTTTPSNDFKVPDEYKEAGWVAKIHSIDDLWKCLANTQALVGKKTVNVPNENSTDAEWEEFNKKMAPEGTEYQFNEETQDEEKTFFTDVFKKNGLPKKAGDAILKAYNERMQEQIEILTNKEDFNKLFAEKIGSEEDKVEIDNIVNKYLKSDNAQIMSTFTNEQLIAFTSIIDGIRKDYGVSLDSKLNSGDQTSSQNVPSNERAQALTKELLEKQQKGSMDPKEEQRLINAIAEANGLK